MTGENVESLALIKSKKENQAMLERFEEITEIIPIESYRYGLKNFLNFLRDKGLLDTLFISTETFWEHSKKYFAHRKKQKMAPATLNTERSAIRKAVGLIFKGDLNKRAVLAELFRDKSRKNNPFRLDPIETRINATQILSHEELIKLFSAGSDKDRLFFTFLYKSACRVSEMCNIELKNTHRINGHYLIKLENTKTSGTATLQTPFEVALIDEIKAVFGSREYLFEHGPEPTPYTRQYIFARIRSVGLRALNRPLSPHKLRHSALTHLYEQTHDIKKTSELARHKKVSTTSDTYIQTTLKPEDFELFNDLLKQAQEKQVNEG